MEFMAQILSSLFHLRESPEYMVSKQYICTSGGSVKDTESANLDV